MHILNALFLPGALISFKRSIQIPPMSWNTSRKKYAMFQSEQSSFAFVFPHKRILWIEWSKRCKTGICSTMGSSLAIVPARSQEFVMLTNDWNNSAQKYPHVVPINCNFGAKGNEERNFLIQSTSKKKNLLIQVNGTDAFNHEFFISFYWVHLRLNNRTHLDISNACQGFGIR